MIDRSAYFIAYFNSRDLAWDAKSLQKAAIYPLRAVFLLALGFSLKTYLDEGIGLVFLDKLQSFNANHSYRHLPQDLNQINLSLSAIVVNQYGRRVGRVMECEKSEDPYKSKAIGYHKRQPTDGK